MRLEPLSQIMHDCLLGTHTLTLNRHTSQSALGCRRTARDNRQLCQYEIMTNCHNYRVVFVIPRVCNTFWWGGCLEYVHPATVPSPNVFTVHIVYILHIVRCIHITSRQAVVPIWNFMETLNITNILQFLLMNVSDFRTLFRHSQHFFLVFKEHKCYFLNVQLFEKSNVSEN